MFGQARSAGAAQAAWITAAAAAALLLGGWVYGVDRLPGTTAWLPLNWGRAPGAGRWFGAVGDWLPSFVHAFAFALLTLLWLPATRRARGWACGGWWLVDSAFEIGQHPSVSTALAAALPEGWPGWPLVGPTLRHLLRSTFDPADMAAIAAGCVAALACAGAVASVGVRRRSPEPRETRA